MQQVRRFYQHTELKGEPWNFSRKHFRVETLNGVWVKLNRLENRLNPEELRGYLARYVPGHVYMSVTDWLFPERVGPKHKARSAVPIGGEFAIDVDSYLGRRAHRHSISPVTGVCEGCLEVSKHLALELCDRVLDHYSRVQVVFSGRRGFHVHVLDFSYRDWAKPNMGNPLKAMAAARFRYALQVYGRHWDRSHFILSVDPMRVVTVPGTLNVDSGLICLNVGGAGDLEALDIWGLLERASPVSEIWGASFQNVTVALSPARGDENVR